MSISIRSLDERPARIRRQRGLERGGSHDVERADRYLCHSYNDHGCSMYTSPHPVIHSTVLHPSEDGLSVVLPFSPIAILCIFLICILTTILMSLFRQELSSRLSCSNQEMTMNHLERQRSMVNIVTVITITEIIDY